MADVYYRATVRSSDGIFSEKNKERKEREICEATREGERRREREREREREIRRERGIYHRGVYTLFSKRDEKEKRRRVLYKEVEEEQHVTNHLYKGGERQGANTEFSLCSRWTLCARKSDNNFFLSFLLPPSPFLQQNNRRIFTRREERIVW